MLFHERYEKLLKDLFEKIPYCYNQSPMSPESRLPARSVLLLRRGVHRTPAPFEKAGETLLFWLN